MNQPKKIERSNMNTEVDKAMRLLEEVQEILAPMLMKEPDVPSVIEEEPVKEETKEPFSPFDDGAFDGSVQEARDTVKEKIDEVIPTNDITPPRTDLQCPLCGSKVYDNRPNKASGQYKATAGDFTCSNNNDCSGMVQGKSRKLRKAWWLNSKDLPQDWIRTEVPPTDDPEDTVQISPFN